MVYNTIVLPLSSPPPDLARPRPTSPCWLGWAGLGCPLHHDTGTKTPNSLLTWLLPCLLACWLAYLLARSLSYLLTCLPTCLLTCLLRRLLARVYLHSCLLPCWLAHLLAYFQLAYLQWASKSQIRISSWNAMGCQIQKSVLQSAMGSQAGIPAEPAEGSATLPLAYNSLKNTLRYIKCKQCLENTRTSYFRSALNTYDNLFRRENIERQASTQAATRRWGRSPPTCSSGPSLDRDRPHFLPLFIGIGVLRLLVYVLLRSVLLLGALLRDDVLLRSVLLLAIAIHHLAGKTLQAKEAFRNRPGWTNAWRAVPKGVRASLRIVVNESMSCCS